MHFECAPSFLSEPDVVYVVPHTMTAALVREDGFERHRILVFGPGAFLRQAFLLGALDYVKDPWTPEELYLRAARFLQESFRIDDQEFWIQGRELRTTGAEVVTLSWAERNLLVCLARCQGSLVHRATLEGVLGSGDRGDHSRVLDVRISSLRKKIRGLAQGPKAQNPLTVVRGQGYVLSRFFSCQ